MPSARFDEPRWGWCVIPLVAALVGCSPPGGNEVTPRVYVIPPAVDLQAKPSLVALGEDGDVLRIGQHAVVSDGLALSNGAVRLRSDAELGGDLEAIGNVTLDAMATVVHDVSTTGTIGLGAGAVIGGTAQGGAALSPAVFPSATELVSDVPVDFPVASAGDLIVPQASTVALAAGTQRYSNVTIGKNATLQVGGDARIRVDGELRLEQFATISIAPGGSLLLFATGNVVMRHHARIRQTDPQVGNLVIVFGETGTFSPDLAALPSIEIGPALIYAPTVDLRLGQFIGAVVARSIEIEKSTQLTLDPRYLACFADTVLPTIAISQPVGSGRAVAPGTSSIAVTGSVADDAYVESLQLEDAGGVHPIDLAVDGTFAVDAALDTGATENTICLDATDCAGNHGRECFVVGYYADIDFVIGSPRAGVPVGEATVSVSGRVTRGEGASVTANGDAGSIRNGYFVVSNVALVSGWNLVDVEVTSTTPQVARRRMLVARDDVPRAVLRIRSRGQNTSIASVTSIGAGPMPRDASGTLFYRLLDDDGEIHRGRIPGTADGVAHFIDGDGNLASDPEPGVGDVDAIIPDYPAATRVQVLGLGGDVIAESAL